MLHGEVYAGGLDLKFFASADFEPITETEHSLITARNVIRILMMGWRDNWKDVVSWQTFSAVFLKRDHELTKGMRQAFQQGFEHLYSQLQSQNLPPLMHKQAELFISNCLAYLPFSDPTPYESFKIPQWVNGRWQLIDYKVVPIELTPTSGFKKLFLSDEDRVFAYGLEPLNNSDASSHLIFMGTTYPAGQGFFTQLNTDMEAFQTVGNQLYRSGRPAILKWLNSQTNPLHVCGTSLGGSLALMLARDQGDKLTSVDAMNPAGIYSTRKRSSLNRWNEFTHKPVVTVQRQGTDPVSFNGEWEDDWILIQVDPPEDKKGPNPLTDHALNYAGFKDSKFIHVDPVNDNRERLRRNFWLYGILRAVVYYSVLVPFRFIFQPMLRYLISHKLQSALSLALITLFVTLVLLSGLALPIMGTTMLIAFATTLAVIAAYHLSQIFFLIRGLFTGKKEADLSKYSQWLFNNLYSTGALLSFLGAGMIITMSLLALSILPLFQVISLSVLVIMSIPLIIKGIIEIYDIINIFWGNHAVSPPKCQEPELPRNKDQDIYQNKIEAEFTIQELGDYYWARRCIAKGKGLIPEENDSGRDKFDGLSKFELIKKHEENPSDATVIEVNVTKAKLYNMKQTVQLINRFGIHSNVNDARTELKNIHAEYQAGKTMR